jgi:hypothetical protein
MSRPTLRRLIVGLLLGALLALPAQAWQPWRTAGGLPPSLLSICHGGNGPAEPGDPDTTPAAGLHCALCGVLPALALPPAPPAAPLREDLATAAPPAEAPAAPALTPSPLPPARGPPAIDRR